MRRRGGEGSRWWDGQGWSDHVRQGEPRRDFSVTDAAGTEVARITKRWKGPPRTPFTTARRYAVHVDVRLPEPLAGMTLASTLTLDTALDQDERVD